METFRQKKCQAGHIKGAALSEFLNWYGKEFGINVVWDKIDRLSPEAKRLLTNQDKMIVGVLATTWYPAPVIHAFLESLFRGMNQENQQTIIAYGAKHVMEKTLHGVYRLLFRTMISPNLYARFSQKLWDRYYDNGTMKKRTMGRHMQSTTITDWNSHHPILCDLNYEASAFIYGAMGCKNVHSNRTGCVSRGDTACSFEITWSN